MPIRVSERNKIALDILVGEYLERTGKRISYDDMLTIILEDIKPKTVKQAEKLRRQKSVDEE